jgi:hypothetical protein
MISFLPMMYFSSSSFVFYCEKNVSYAGFWAELGLVLGVVLHLHCMMNHQFAPLWVLHYLVSFACSWEMWGLALELSRPGVFDLARWALVKRMMALTVPQGLTMIVQMSQYTPWWFTLMYTVWFFSAFVVCVFGVCWVDVHSVRLFGGGVLALE